MASLLIVSTDYKNKILKYVLFVICASNILFIITRQKQVLFFVYLLLYFFVTIFHESNKTKLFFKKSALFVGSLLFVFLLIYRFDTFKDLFNNLFDSGKVDNIERQLAISDSVNMFSESSFLGVGYGNYSLFKTKTELASPHNGFFSVLAEFGVVGVAASFVLVSLSIIYSFKIFSAKIEKHYYAMAIVLLLSALLFFISNFEFLPPPNERAYYLECSIVWSFLGMVSCKIKEQYDKKNVD